MMSATDTLDTLRQGEIAIVKGLSLSGGIRRRLQDIGMIPGTRVECMRVSPLGDPVSYLFRGSVVAIRRADASRITIMGRVMDDGIGSGKADRAGGQSERG